MKTRFVLKAGLARLKHIFGKNTPLRVLHRVTSRCNLRCSFCDHELHESKGKELSTEEIKECMNQFARLGAIAWGITGGEPFLRKDISQIIRHSKQLGFLTNIITNGTLATESQIAEVSSSLDYLVTSLEGPKEITDKIRGQGVFDKVVHTIEVARRNNLPVIAAVLLTRDFIEAKGLEFMGRFSKEMGIRCSFQNLLLAGPYGGRGFKEEKPKIVPHNPDKQTLFEALDRILYMRSLGYPFVNNKPWVDYVKAFMNKTLKPPKCFAGKLYCNFFEDGSLRTCQYHPLRIKKETIGESFRSLPGQFSDCPCLAICYINYNLAYSFNFSMIMDGFKNTLGYRD
ncbi:MAG: radical SAM protein [Candidatus Omnitrophica bacterium]|nr:radical SAM protein [Candidatus Omnitrophota bacterium]